MIAIIGDVLAQATQAASKGTTATDGASLPDAGFSLPLVILTVIALAGIVFGATKFFQTFKKF